MFFSIVLQQDELWLKTLFCEIYFCLKWISALMLFKWISALMLIKWCKPIVNRPPPKKVWYTSCSSLVFLWLFNFQEFLKFFQSNFILICTAHSQSCKLKPSWKKIRLCVSALYFSDFFTLWFFQNEIGLKVSKILKN